MSTPLHICPSVEPSSGEPREPGTGDRSGHSSRRYARLFLSLLPAMLCVVAMQAEKPGAPPNHLPLLTQVRQIRGLSAEQAQRGYRVRIRGVVANGDIAGQTEGSEWVETEGVVLRPPPWWTLKRALGVLGIMSGLVLGGLAWVVMLKRQVREQTKGVRELLRREGALKDQYRDLFENASDIIFTHDLDGNITSLNKAGELLTGYSRQEAAYLKVAEVIVPEQRERLAEALSRLQQGELAPHGEWELIAKDGRRMSFEISQRLIVEAGKPVGVHGIARDITERRRVEREIQKRTARLNSFIENSPLGIVVADSEGRVQMCNPAFERLFLYHQSDILGANLMELFGAEETQAEMAAWGPFIQGGETAHFASQRRRRTGKLLEVEIHIVPLLEGGRVTGSFRLYQDVTERKQAERAMRQLSGRLLQLQDEERRRIARELHDTTAQALAALVMNLTLLEKSLPPLDSKGRNALSDSVALAEQCAREIRTLSYLLHPPLLDEVGLAAALQQYVEGFTQRSGVQVDLDLPRELDRLPGEVETALFRVVQESLTNIHRHSGSRQARIRLVRGSTELKLEVEDEGKGIPREIRDGSNGTAPGLGVGILGMRERLRQLRGRLEINSNGHGTTVRAVLPLPGESHESTSHSDRG